MAKIILGLSTSHSGQLNTPPERWSVRREKDIQDSRIDFRALASKAKAGIDKEITVEKMRERFEACMRGLATLSEELKRVSPDILVVVGDDQHEQFQADNMPTFCIYRSNTAEVVGRSSRRTRRAWSAAEEWKFPESPKSYSCVPELAEHIIKFLSDAGFDPACSNQLKADTGIGHAFSFI